MSSFRCTGGIKQSQFVADRVCSMRSSHRRIGKDCMRRKPTVDGQVAENGRLEFRGFPEVRDHRRRSAEPEAAVYQRREHAVDIDDLFVDGYRVEADGEWLSAVGGRWSVDEVLVHGPNISSTADD